MQCSILNADPDRWSVICSQFRRMYNAVWSKLHQYLCNVIHVHRSLWLLYNNHGKKVFAIAIIQLSQIGSTLFQWQWDEDALWDERPLCARQTSVRPQWSDRARWCNILGVTDSCAECFQSFHGLETGSRLEILFVGHPTMPADCNVFGHPTVLYSWSIGFRHTVLTQIFGERWH